MIILEGPDNTGKSTLAESLTLKLDWPVIHPGGKPANQAEELRMILHQLKLSKEDIIHDRVTCISQPVYNVFRDDAIDLSYRFYLDEMLKNPNCVIVYCRPPKWKILDLATHEAKAHDSPEHLKMITDNAVHILSEYDKMFETIPHVKYDYTVDTIESLLERLNDLSRNPQ